MRQDSPTDQGPQQYITNLVVGIEAPGYYSMVIYHKGRQDLDLRYESRLGFFEPLPFDHTRFRWTVKDNLDLDTYSVISLRTVQGILDVWCVVEDEAQGSL